VRILQIHNRYIFPGGEDASVDRIFGAISQDHRVERCIFESSSWKKDGAPRVWQQALLMWSNPGSLQKIHEAHCRMRADCWLVHNFVPVVSAGVYRLAARLRVPVVQYCHNFRPFSVSGYLWAHNRLAPSGLDLNFWPEIGSGSWQNSKVKTFWLACIFWHLHWSGFYRKTAAWITISEFMKSRFVEAGLPKAKVYSLRHSWDIINTMQIATDLQTGYIFLGRLTDEKGVGVLIEAWNLLRGLMGDRCPFLLIGGDGPLRGYCETAARVNDRICCQGYVSGAAKKQLLQQCRAVLAPSLCWEGLGLVAYEAYDYSKPVFAASSGGLTEVVIDGRTGRLHKPGCASELAQQIIELELNPTRGLEWGANGRQWLESNTSQTIWRERINKILKQVVES